jgi:hypothetical protein
MAAAPKVTIRCHSIESAVEHAKGGRENNIEHRS